MNFCANSARLLRKLDHVLLWILSNDTRLLQCSLCAKKWKFQWLAMFCLCNLPLAKIQMLTAIYRFWSWFLETRLIWVIFIISLGVYLCKGVNRFNLDEPYFWSKLYINMLENHSLSVHTWRFWAKIVFSHFFSIFQMDYLMTWSSGQE